MNIFTVISILTPPFPPLMHAMFASSNMAVRNAMACRVLRQLHLGILNNGPFTQPTHPFTGIEFTTPASSQFSSQGQLSVPSDA